MMLIMLMIMMMIMIDGVKAHCNYQPSQASLNVIMPLLSLLLHISLSTVMFKNSNC